MKKEIINREEVKISLFDDSSLSFNFTILFISACLIATFGLLGNSSAVIIGAMIIAPLMMPLRGLAYALLNQDFSLFKGSVKALAAGTFFSILLSCLIGKLAGFPEFGSEVMARTAPNLLDLGIAIVAGVVSGIAKVRPKIGDAVAGTAISVALMPPLCVVGLTLSQGQLRYSIGALLLYMTNFLGITLACMCVFALTGYKREKGLNHSLNWMFIIITILAIPLGLSFINLLKQNQVESTLKKVLLNKTITVGKNVDLIKTYIDWNITPPEVHLNVKTNALLTSKQIQLVQNFLKKEMDEEFTLVFEVIPITEIRAISNLKSVVNVNNNNIKSSNFILPEMNNIKPNPNEKINQTQEIINSPENGSFGNIDTKIYQTPESSK